MNGNTPSELLSMLVDGELDSTQETSLYTYLAGSEELRAEMRELLAIKESVRNDTEAFTIPQGMKKRVFAAVGLTPASSPDVPVTQAIIRNSMLKSTWNKVWSPLLSAAVATALTALFFMLFFNNGNVTTDRAGNTKNTVPVVSSQENDRTNNEQAITGTDNKQRTGRKHSGQLSVNNASIADESNSGISKNDVKIPDNRETQGNNLEYASLVPDKNSDNFSSMNYGETGKLPAVFSPGKNKMLEQIQSNGLGITLLVRGISASSNPSAEINSQANPVFNNMGIGGYVNIFDNVDVGLEIGQEPYPQSYYQNSIAKVEQNYTTFWAGFSIKAMTGKHIEFLAGAMPYGQIIIGGSRLGPIGRLAAGLQYSWNNSFGVMLGLEGSMLVYKYQGRTYSTEKIGMTYGLTYSF